jgi:hypothetical protein
MKLVRRLCAHFRPLASLKNRGNSASNSLFRAPAGLLTCIALFITSSSVLAQTARETMASADPTPITSSGQMQAMKLRAPNVGCPLQQNHYVLHFQ